MESDREAIAEELSGPASATTAIATWPDRPRVCRREPGPYPRDQRLPIPLQLAHERGGRSGSWIIPGAPADDLEHRRDESQPLLRRRVGLAAMVGRVRDPGDDPGLDEPAEPIRQDVRGDPLVGVEELLEARLSLEDEVAEDQQGPAVPEEVQPEGDGAARSTVVGHVT